MTSFAALTSHQLQVARLVARGRLNKQIAHELGITEATVKCHIAGIKARVGLVGGASSRVQVALWYLANCGEAEAATLLAAMRASPTQ